MTSDRVYRRGRPDKNAAQELYDWAGKQFDANLVAAFHRVPKQDWDELRLQSVVKAAKGDLTLPARIQREAKLQVLSETHSHPTHWRSNS